MPSPVLPGSDLYTLPDEILAQGVQKGLQTHLTILVERYHAPLLRFLLRMSHENLQLAEDLVQETFLHLLASIAQYRYPRPFRPWLYTIAHNLLRDHFKRADTQRTATLPDEEMDQWQSGLPTPDTAVSAQETQQQIISVLQRLPLQQKETILLRYVEELSLREISEILKIPEGTVKSRLSLGLKQLREFMQQERA